MGYGKSKPAMFKMKHQGVPALMKTLVGNQKNLPENLKKAIEAAPENAAAKSYGSKKKAALMKDPTDDKRKKALEKARKAREEFQAKNPDAKFNTPTEQPKKKPSTIATGIKGDLTGGGYSKKQKDLAVAEAYKTAAEKKRKKAKASGVDVEAANKRFRKNTAMGKALTRQGY